MGEEKLLKKLSSYFQQGEEEKKKIGMEVEHFVLKENNLEAVDYADQCGISDILEHFQGQEIKQYREDDHLLKLTAPEYDITIEPGAQLEVGIQPQSTIQELETVYFNFLDKLVPILNERDYLLLTLGYQPESKIEDIAWLPKKRYQIMSNYLGQRGKYAHNMMKGTAAFQIAFDYHSEADFVNKFRVATVLSPVLAIVCDNAPFFEGGVFSNEALRTLIWNHTDNSRARIVEEAFASDFGYQKYAQYILTREPILLKSNDRYTATHKKTAAEIFQDRELGREELEHILTMVFPDVRAKQFIEIRMADSLPPRYFLALASLWKGILYNEEILQQVVSFVEQFNAADVITARQDIIAQGLAAQLGDYSILEIADKILTWAHKGLPGEEKHYLKPLQAIVEEEKTLAQKIKQQVTKVGKKEVIKDYSLNSLVEEAENNGESLCGI